MSELWIDNVRLFDPGGGIDIPDRCVHVERGEIVSLDAKAPSGAEVIDGQGHLLCPGLIDLRAHVGEPGFTRRETLRTCSEAAAAGGFTSILAMPTTKPTIDCIEVVELMTSQAQKAGGTRVMLAGALSVGRKGERLAEMALLQTAGCVAFTDGDQSIKDSQLLRYAMETAGDLGALIITHAEDESLSLGGVMHEGLISTRLGLRGAPGAAEVVGVSRDLAIAELTQTRLHIGHVSTHAATELIRQARRRGIRVTAEVSPLHLCLTDEAVLGYKTFGKVQPPLRPSHDVDAMIQGLADGTIDVVASDHCPQIAMDKNVEFDRAAAGAIGLETALGVVLSLVKEKRLTLQRAIAVLTRGPAQVLGRRDIGRLQQGGAADLVVIDPEHAWEFTQEGVRSKSFNSPLFGRPLFGRAMCTIAGGEVTHNILGAKR